MISLGRSALRRLGGEGRSPQRRLADSDARRRRRAVVGLVLLVVGIGLVAAGYLVGRVAPPAAVQVDPDGTTAVPRTWFFQSEWVLFGTVDDPRRVPALATIGCRTSGLSVPPRPADLTQYGSRVVGTTSISALAPLGRSGEGATISCESAGEYEPLWLKPASVAPPFTPTAIVIAGFVLLVAAALTHPATAHLQARWPRVGRDQRD